MGNLVFFLFCPQFFNKRSSKNIFERFFFFVKTIQKLKNSFPIELTKLEKISSEVRRSFNELVHYNFSNSEIINSLRSKVKDILIRIN